MEFWGIILITYVTNDEVDITSLTFELWLNGVKSMIKGYYFYSQSCINSAFWL